MRNTIDDKEKLADKIDESDKQTIKDALQESQDWLSSHEDADRDDYETHLKDLQKVCDPIISKVYQQQGGQAEHGSEDEEHEDL